MLSLEQEKQTTYFKLLIFFLLYSFNEVDNFSRWFFPSNCLQFELRFWSLDVTHNKVCSEKKCTRICTYYSNTVEVSQKSLGSAKSRHSEVSKMVRQVYIAQKMSSVAMFLYFKKICENTIFVKKRISKVQKKCFPVFYVKSQYNCKNGVKN